MNAPIKRNVLTSLYVAEFGHMAHIMWEERVTRK